MDNVISTAKKNDSGKSEVQTQLKSSLPEVKNVAFEGERPEELLNIYRVGPREEGTRWMVSIERGAKRVFKKSFSDAKYGGRDKSLAAAQAWRDEMRQHYPQMNKREALLKEKKLPPGKPGLIRSTTRRLKKDGSISICTTWLAKSPSWTMENRSKSFSVKKYGEEEAYRLARETLEQYEAEAAAKGLQPTKKMPDRNKPAEMRNIWRVDYLAKKTWLVNIRRNAEDLRLIKHFSDQQYGGEMQALAAAQAWRDEMEKKHPKMTSKERATHKRKNNRSGVPGVHLGFQKYPRLDGESGISVYWVARTPTSILPRRNKFFSIEKYGEREAFELAVEARKAFEALLDND